MKCITCEKEIPDASTKCPYCNNKVEPVVTAGEALGVKTESVLPSVPTEYKLPKDQAFMTTEAPVVNTTDILPPEPPKMDDEETTEEAEDIGSVSEPEFDPSTINLENVDLNANANAITLDMTKEQVDGKISSSAPAKPAKTRKKISKKTIILSIVGVFVLALIGVGIYFYNKEFKTSDAKIRSAVNKLFSFTNSITNDSINKGTGAYSLSYSHGNENDILSFNVDGKYGYNLKNSKIDLISNFKSYNHNKEILDNELNTEIYLDGNRAYFLMQNFNDNYIYTDVSNTYNVIKDVESRFNEPDKLFLFKNIDFLYFYGLNNLSLNYDNISQNIASKDVNYKNIINGVKNAVANALVSLPSTQKIEGSNNVVRINLNNADTVKRLHKNVLENIHNNKSVYDEISKIFEGSNMDFYEYYSAKLEDCTFDAINGDIVIVTGLFNDTIKYITIPVLYEESVINLTITPSGNGYRLVGRTDKEIINLTYSKSSSSTSTTNNKVYKIEGTVIEKGETKNLNITLQLTKDITPQELNVVTRNSIDYKYLTFNDYNDIANKIRNYGTLGQIFNDSYKGAVVPDEEFNNEGE